ncbi:ubiquinol-cytochrome c reductase iron-sulfur subunit [Georgenia yuyongxinii]|uniref:Cytochrome bc1 complex Rieske iron-sulfur subunit n=1 Tax=Georgenia yuyongxinii TaxID=2589797 RepID=A0A552WNC1_9MICO|nr:Rieske (2Fe-2S) protein [Georgenia yuyongxinii]TRW44261.1 Rieske (2Fe-2S) protein [Georgenia yuyongxinii]
MSSAHVCEHAGACVSRRRVLVAGGAGLVLTPLLVACGSGAEPAAPTPAGSGQPGERLVALSEVPVGSGVVVETAGGESVVVAQPETGKVLAFSAVCTHQGCLVAVEGQELACPCHGSRFAAASGEVLQGPAEKPLPAVPVRVDGEDVVLG